MALIEVSQETRDALYDLAWRLEKPVANPNEEFVIVPGIFAAFDVVGRFDKEAEA